MKIANFLISLLSLLLAGLIIINVAISQGNAQLSTQLLNAQQVIAASKNYEAELRALTIRVAQSAVKNSALRDLLLKHQLRATIDVNGKSQDVP